MNIDTKKAFDLLNYKLTELLAKVDELSETHASNELLVRVSAGKYLRRRSTGYCTRSLGGASFFLSDGAEATWVVNRMNGRSDITEPVIWVEHEEALAETVALFMGEVAVLRNVLALLTKDEDPEVAVVYQL